jgi:hypothetical protein
VRKISDWIEDGRLWWSGYSVARRENVTSDTYPPDFTTRIDPGSKMHILRLDAREDDTIEGVQIVLPPPANAKTSVRRWRKPPSRTRLEAAARAIAKKFNPDNPPTFPQWKAALKKKLRREITVKCAHDALVDFAPQLLRKRGHKLNRRS